MFKFFFALSTFLCFSLAVGPAQVPLFKIPAALNPQLTNILDNDTITLYYNGSGPVPGYDELSPLPEPITPLNQSMIEDSFFDELMAILPSTAYPDPCTKCIAAGQLMHVVAISEPVDTVTNLLVRVCNTLDFFRDSIRSSSCEAQFGSPGQFGPHLAQLFSKMSLTTGDYQAICSIKKFGLCEEQPPLEIDEDLFFEPKPKHADTAPEPSGEIINVLHLSDFHLDPRFDIGSEGNCSQKLCCRPYSNNVELETDWTNPSIPASRFGSYSCDSPPDLALSAFTSMSEFFDINKLAFTIFTGDTVSHDRDDTLSMPYVSYSEETAYHIFKQYLGDTPVYATLGNHETIHKDFVPQHVLNPDPTNTSTNALAWNYDLLSSLWEKNEWLNTTEAAWAKTHYGVYATTTAQGLRVISLNSDFWYRVNVFNYWNISNPDPTGMFRWLSDELTRCEKHGQRAWIIAHALTGHDGTAALPNPSALFHSIVRRFSPGTIAAIFFGHTHLDQFQIFYDYLPDSIDFLSGKRDTTKVDFSRPLVVGHVGPSVTPLTGLNAGYRVYQVDNKTFEVLGAQTYFANISNSLKWTMPVWELEYDARSAYSIVDKSPFGQNPGVARPVNHGHKPRGSWSIDDDLPGYNPRVPWPIDSPLNATFWHRVTESMLEDSDSPQSLLKLYNHYETKSTSSAFHRGFVAVSAEQKVCFLRAGTSADGTRCRKFYGGDDGDDDDGDDDDPLFAHFGTHRTLV
ncbi:hypothetical protein LTR84_008892 [Exophiala bonariae]|uniref:Calcineurin-like phosphoesterase domain-containing protein n=1 Tax=Exophiala bonariae TaxID=1690606 RepID=A0AAV9MVS6_9EURO|nr:hypothetical protein LTR84_008892 [Exophiala bonariae]